MKFDAWKPQKSFVEFSFFPKQNQYVMAQNIFFDVDASVDRVALFFSSEYYYECIIINRLLLRFSNFSNNRK